MSADKRAEKKYVVTAPQDGTVIVRLKWANVKNSGHRSLRLEAEDTTVNWECGANWPLTARVQVVTGQHVRIRISRGLGCWEYKDTTPLAELPFEFTLTTALE